MGPSFKRFTYVGHQPFHINAHVEAWHSLQPLERALRNLGRGLMVPENAFQVGCRYLDQALEQPALLGLGSDRAPERLEGLVAFPPVAVIKKVDSVQEGL